MSDPITRLNAALEGRYRIERELGEGGMATVYLADDLKHERKVALKVLKPELAAVIGADRFLAEIKTTANLQHSHILPLYDSGEADGNLFYVMPYVEGESLRERLDREHQLPVDDAVHIAINMAEALDYAHRQGVIHRDIKPANVLLRDGKPVIADFGIALATNAAGGGRLTETGLSLGTPSYMSPEQATGDQHVGTPTDIYSLACVLHEALVGEPPFTGATAQAILGRIIVGEPTSTRDQRKAVPRNVDAAVAKALEKLPADRFASAADFASALADPGFRHGDALVSAGFATGPRRAVGGATLVLLAAVSVVAVLGWLRPEAPRPVSRYALAQHESEVIPEISASFGPSVAVAPDGSSVVYVGSDGANGSALWIKERDAAHARQIPGTESATQPFFYPDNRRVGFLTLDEPEPRAVKVVSLDDGEVVTLVSEGFYRNGATVGPDGTPYLNVLTAIASLSPSGSWEPVTTIAEGEYNHLFPHALPGGRGLLFTVQYGSYQLEDADIAVVDFSTGEHRTLIENAFMPKYAASGHLIAVRVDGTLVAAPFDEKRLELTGPAVPIFAGVNVGLVQGAAYGADIDISDEGMLVYVSAPGVVDSQGKTLEWVNRDGGRRGVVPDWIADFESVKLSPDGSRLAVTVGFDEETDVWIKELGEGPKTPLTFAEGMNRRPEWMPDDTTVSFITDRGDNRDVYGRRSDGQGSAEVLFDFDIHVDEAVWSRDGQWLVYRTGISAQDRDIYAWRVGTDPASAITVSAIPGVDEYAPTLSPDGGYIAYSSDERAPGVQQDIWVRPFPNVDDGKWQISTERGIEPLWAPSGAELFYVSGDLSLVSVPVQTTPTFRRSEEVVLFPLDPYFRFVVHRGYDVTADGQRFIMIRDADTGWGSELIVVENFFEELREKVGG